MIISENIYLPCPFCAYLPEDTNDLDIEIEDHGQTFIASCVNCGAKSSGSESMKDAIKSWNTRASTESSEFLRGYIAARNDITVMIENMKNTVGKENDNQ